jgi:casein kinase II subunit beta
MHSMYEKFRSASFGRCPHVFCQGQPVLPVGLSDMPRNFTVNVFCPRCHGLYFPKSTRQANIDGAYFGTTFPHLYLMTHPDIIPTQPRQAYVPRVYGFRVNEASVYYRHRHPGTTSGDPSESGGLDGSNRPSTTALQSRRSRKAPPPATGVSSGRK